MKLSSLKFNLPKERIALHPRKERDESKLMLIHKKTGKIEHLKFKDIIGHFKKGDSLVLNDTKVFPASLTGKKEKTGAKIDVLLLRQLNENHQWDVLVDPARKIRVGNKLYFGNMDLIAEISDNTTSRGRTLRFLFEGTNEDLLKIFDKLGKPAIPSWILGRDSVPEDRERYQTVYAENIGGAVPSFSGFHFTEYILKMLLLHGVNITPLTVHSSLNDMSFIDVEDISKYRSSAELLNIPENSADMINQSIKNKKKVCAVGLSTLKALESSASSYNTVKANSSWTNKFILPESTFKICNSIITNFHLPRSTLFVSAVAFVGDQLLLEAYAKAIEKKYNFFVYGDSMMVY